ncbi:hypothetical protein R6Q59_019211 [Mikania micrantha]
MSATILSPLTALAISFSLRELNYRATSSFMDSMKKLFAFMTVMMLAVSVSVTASDAPAPAPTSDATTALVSTAIASLSSLVFALVF